MARIRHPRFQPGRTRGLAGIEFIDGYAEVDLRDNDILVQALTQHGYGIEPQAHVEGSQRPAKPSKPSGKGKPAKATKAPEPSNGAPADADSEGIAEDGTIPVQMMLNGEEVEIGRVQVQLTNADLAKLTESPEA